MDARTKLTRLDGAMRRLLVEADFAEARFGTAYGAGLRHCHDELVPVMTVAFQHLRSSTDPTLSIRDRAGFLGHVDAVCTALERDLEHIEQRFGELTRRQVVAGPGARAIVEAAVARGRASLDSWWEGRVRLGPLESPAVAASDWRRHRPAPRWIAWAVGSSAAVSVAIPSLIIFL